MRKTKENSDQATKDEKSRLQRIMNLSLENVNSKCAQGTIWQIPGSHRSQISFGLALPSSDPVTFFPSLACSVAEGTHSGSQHSLSAVRPLIHSLNLQCCCGGVGTECVPADVYVEAQTPGWLPLEMGPLRKQLGLNELMKVGPSSNRISVLIRSDRRELCPCGHAARWWRPRATRRVVAITRTWSCVSGLLNLCGPPRLSFYYGCQSRRRQK